MEKYLNSNIPFFSIIITVYNGELTIEETLESIFCQTYKNFELLIYNDGSEDNTDIIINKLLIKFKFEYKLFPKTGRVVLLNEAIRNAKGHYICICDSDDIWHPQKLEFQNKFIENNPEVYFVSTKMNFFNKKVTFQTHHNYAVKAISHYLLYLYNPISHSSIAFKKGIVNYSDTVQHDYNLYFDLIDKKIILYKINIILTYNRIHLKQNYQSGGRKYYNNSLDLIKLKIYSSGKYYFFIFYFIKYIYFLMFSKIRRNLILIFRSF